MQRLKNEFKDDINYCMGNNYTPDWIYFRSLVIRLIVDDSIMRRIISKSYLNQFITDLKPNTQKTVYIESNIKGDKIIYDKYKITKLNKVVEQKIKRLNNETKNIKGY